VVEIVQVWDAKTGQRVRSFPVTQPAISQDYGGSLYNVEVHGRALCDRYLAVQKIRAVNLNGQRSLSPFLEVWDIEKGSIIFTLQGIELGDIQWAPDRRRLALLTNDRYKNTRWEIWDIPMGQRIRSFPLTYNPLPSTMVWSPDGQSIALGPDIYSVETGRKVMTYHIAGQQTLEVMAWSPDEKRVVVRSSSDSGGGLSHALFRKNPLFVLDASSSRMLLDYDDIGGSFISSPNGAYFLDVEKSSGTVDVWRMS
jgi:WD40 repeat protein